MKKEPKKITVRLILAWIFSILFILGGVGSLISSIFGGLLMILAGVMLLPPFRKMLEEKARIKLSGWLKILIVLILLVIAGLIITSEESPILEFTEEEKQSTEIQTTFNMGEKMTASGIEYTIEGASTLPIVGSEFLTKEADGTFVIISLTVKNNRNSEILLTSNDFRLKDSQGRRYNVDTGASMYLSTMGFNAFMFKKLGAGLSTQGETIFDVPIDDKGLILEISGEGLFSDTRYVQIGDISELG